MACDALTLLPAVLRSAPPLGSSNSTRPSQNAKRNKKNITRTSPATLTTACELKVAGRLEGRVRDARTFLSIIEQNKSKIFQQFEKIEFV